MPTQAIVKSSAPGTLNINREYVRKNREKFLDSADGRINFGKKSYSEYIREYNDKTKKLNKELKIQAKETLQKVKRQAKASGTYYEEFYDWDM